MELARAAAGAGAGAAGHRRSAERRAGPVQSSIQTDLVSPDRGTVGLYNVPVCDVNYCRIIQFSRKLHSAHASQLVISLKTAGARPTGGCRVSTIHPPLGGPGGISLHFFSWNTVMFSWESHNSLPLPKILATGQ